MEAALLLLVVPLLLELPLPLAALTALCVMVDGVFPSFTRIRGVTCVRLVGKLTCERRTALRLERRSGVGHDAGDVLAQNVVTCLDAV